jgi:cardiolipin synthase
VARRAIVLILPSLVTLARLGAVPVIVWLILETRFAAAFWTFGAAGLSDALDGALARRLDARTSIGGYLDAIADKTLLASVYLALGRAGLLPGWLVVLVVGRDLLIVGGVLLCRAVAAPLMVAPLRISKLNTAAQIALAALVLALAALNVADPGIAVMMVYLVAATTAMSGAAYLVIWGRRRTGLESW